MDLGFAFVVCGGLWMSCVCIVYKFFSLYDCVCVVLWSLVRVAMLCLYVSVCVAEGLWVCVRVFHLVGVCGFVRLSTCLRAYGIYPTLRVYSYE